VDPEPLRVRRHLCLARIASCERCKRPSGEWRMSGLARDPARDLLRYRRGIRGSLSPRAR
jgi:hypothetical protein